MLDPNGVTLGSRATAQALRFLRSLIDEGLMSPEVLGYEWTRPIRLLAEGKAAISFGGSYEARTVAEALGVPLDELWDHVGFIPVPAGPGGRPASVAGTMSYGIFRQAAQPGLAVRLLERALAPEALARIARTTGRIPARRSAIRLVTPEPVPLADRRPPGARRDPAGNTLVSARFGTASSHAGGSTHGAAECGRGGAAGGRAGRRDHGAPGPGRKAAAGAH